MFDNVKSLILELLKDKEVSLAMIYNKSGEILWHKGREILGKTISEGTGFSKSLIAKTLKEENLISKEDVSLFPYREMGGSNLPQSARGLNIKSILILPVKNYFLYIDSGTKISFCEVDKIVLKKIGFLLEDILHKVNIQSQSADLGGISGNSSQLISLRERIINYSIEEEPILLLGETGSGKSHIARIIHKFSGKAGKFITINTPSIPENLFESVIFGHKKGAFTDARSDQKGFVDEAEGGTLFFDEISEVPVHFQAKLLRFIETKKYNILGETQERDANIRIIAATNKNLREEIKAKTFREDLYYRLNVLEINIPPLRDRKEDIRNLGKEMLHYLKGKPIGNGFWEALDSYSWPGNTRELITVLKRLGINGSSPITGNDVRNEITMMHSNETISLADITIERIWEEIQSGKNFWNAVKAPYLNREINRSQVQTIIKRGLKETSGKHQGQYKGLLKIFHIDPDRYKNFMAFLKQNKII